jgi:hypothetical protein
MRTAIFFASINISTALLRIAEAQGTIVEQAPEGVGYFYLYLFLIFAVMDIVDFFRSRR